MYLPGHERAGCPYSAEKSKSLSGEMHQVNSWSEKPDHQRVCSAQLPTDMHGQTMTRLVRQLALKHVRMR